jgi:Protein of unknown function (DUF3645)/Protein of unknown function (DUF3638)
VLATQQQQHDIMDEVDELLRVKYQLVYTVGGAEPVSGGTLRWTVACAVLACVSKHAADLAAKHGADAVEYSAATVPGGFPYIRILQEHASTDLMNMITDDIVSGTAADITLPELSTTERTALKQFLLSPEIDAVSLQIVSAFTETVYRNTVLILRGLVGNDVLLLALGKRWRVDYGVNTSSNRRRMAVPFRAKDVPSERAEFGHADIAITLTILSYYSSGLTDAQLHDAMSRLKSLNDPDIEYSKWSGAVGSTCMPVSLQTLSGVNLADSTQVAVLFPLLRSNPRVIDFWLGSAVFPVESKQFRYKLAASAWDMTCNSGSDTSQQAARVTATGFSGTNDARLLLPLSIQQCDLPSLQGTFTITQV